MAQRGLLVSSAMALGWTCCGNGRQCRLFLMSELHQALPRVEVLFVFSLNLAVSGFEYSPPCCEGGVWGRRWCWESQQTRLQLSVEDPASKGRW